MTKRQFLKDAEEFSRNSEMIHREDYEHYKLLVKVPHKIGWWARKSEFFSDAIGRELFRLAMHGETIDRAAAALRLGDEFAADPITILYPCIDVGGCGDGLFPVALFRTRKLIIVDPAAEKNDVKSEQFDYGDRVDRLTIEYVPKRIQDLGIKFEIGSIMINCLDSIAVPYVFELAKTRLLKGGYLFRSPSFDPGRSEMKRLSMLQPETVKCLNYVDAEMALKKYDLRKIHLGDLNCDLYKKVEKFTL